LSKQNNSEEQNNQLIAKDISLLLNKCGHIFKREFVLKNKLLSDRAGNYLLSLLPLLASKQKLLAMDISQSIWGIGKLAEQGMTIPLTPEATASICRLIELLPEIRGPSHCQCAMELGKAC